MARNIIVDCDPGIDDALALLFAFAQKAKIEAITTTAGNVGIGQTTRNLLNILHLIRCKRLPSIGRGAAAPLRGQLRTARRVHGRDGLGNTNLPPSRLGPEIGDACAVLANSIRAHPGITVVVTGPLTNIANLFLKEPDMPRFIGRLVVMGGALRVPGNVTKFSEFNIATDPEAAHIVLSSGVPIELISLDVTHKVVLKECHIERFRKIETALSEFILTICGYGIKYHKKNRQAEGMYMHDPLAMAIALDLSLGEFRRLPLGVKLDGRERGRIYIKDGGADVKFCKDVDVKNFFCIFLKGLSRLAAKN